MTTINLHAVIDDQGRLRLDVPTGLPAGDVELEVTLRPTRPSPGTDGPAPRRDAPWTRLIGKLQWQGDAVAQQRRLRDEWPD